VAWSAPKTWVTGETLLAADFNSQLGDDMRHLFDLGNEQYFMRVSSQFTNAAATSDTTYHTERFETPYLKTSLWLRYYGSADLNPSMALLVHSRVLFPVITDSHSPFLNLPHWDASGHREPGYTIMGEWQGIVGPTAITIALRYRVSISSCTLNPGTLIVGVIPTT
jgi:hypothetical protein